MSEHNMMGLMGFNGDGDGQTSITVSIVWQWCLRDAWIKKETLWLCSQCPIYLPILLKFKVKSLNEK